MGAVTVCTNGSVQSIDYFLPFSRLSFHLAYSFFFVVVVVQKLLILIRPHLFIFAFISNILGGKPGVLQSMGSQSWTRLSN